MKKVLYLLITLMAWSWAAIFVKMLAANFDFITQSFYRYIIAAVFLVIVVYVSEKERFFKAKQKYALFIVPSLLIVGFQLMWVKGIELTDPTIAVLISKISVILVVVFSFLLFKDERKIIKSKTFLISLFLGLIGVYGVVMSAGANGKVFQIGSLMIIGSSFLWAAYIVAIKKMVKEIDPFVASAFVYCFSVIWFFILTLLFGSIERVIQVNVWTNILLFGSGILGVALGNMYNYKCVQVYGAAPTSTFLLTTPLFVGIFSYLVLGEVLTSMQIIFGIVLVLGALLAIHPKIHTHTETT